MAFNSSHALFQFRVLRFQFADALTSAFWLLDFHLFVQPLNGGQRHAAFIHVGDVFVILSPFKPNAAWKSCDTGSRDGAERVIH